MVTSEQLLKFVKDAASGNKFMDDQLGTAVTAVTRLVEIETSYKLNMDLLAERERNRFEQAVERGGLALVPTASN